MTPSKRRGFTKTECCFFNRVKPSIYLLPTDKQLFITLQCLTLVGSTMTDSIPKRSNLFTFIHLE